MLAGSFCDEGPDRETVDIDATPADKNNAGSGARGGADAAGAPARNDGLAGQRLALAGEQRASRAALLRLFYQVEIRDLQLLKP